MTTFVLINERVSPNRWNINKMELYCKSRAFTQSTLVFALNIYDTSATLIRFHRKLYFHGEQSEAFVISQPCNLILAVIQYFLRQWWPFVCGKLKCIKIYIGAWCRHENCRNFCIVVANIHHGLTTVCFANSVDIDISYRSTRMPLRQAIILHKVQTEFYW